MLISDWSSDVCSSDLHAAAVRIDEEIERAPRAVEHVDRTPAADRHAIDLRFHRERGEIAYVEPRAEQQAVVDADVGDDATGRMVVAVGRGGACDLPARADQIGRAHVCTPVTNATLVYLPML